MKDFYVRDAAQHENQNITTTFVVAAKQIKPKKTGDLYIALTLADRTGQIEAKVWDNVQDCIDCFEQDDFVKVKALLNKYNNRFQLTIHKVRKCEEHEVDFFDYLPKTDKDVEQLWQTLREYVAAFQNDQLRSLIQAFMTDPEIETRYKN